MKRILLLFLFIQSFSLISQITVTPESLEKTIDNNIPEYIFDIYVTNSSSTEQSFWWKIFREDDTPKEWDLFVCDFQLCYSPSVTACPPSKPNKMPADTTMKITFHLKSNEFNGAAKLWLEFYSDKTYQTLYDRTDSLGVVTVASPNSVSDDNFQFSIFPNPVFDKIIIDAKDLNNKEVRISSVSGLELISLNEIPQNGISVNELQNGIYFISLIDKSSRKKTTYKFVKTN